jgi:hypothetical protein
VRYREGERDMMKERGTKRELKRKGWRRRRQRKWNLKRKGQRRCLIVNAQGILSKIAEYT